MNRTVVFMAYSDNERIVDVIKKFKRDVNQRANDISIFDNVPGHAFDEACAAVDNATFANRKTDDVNFKDVNARKAAKKKEAEEKLRADAAATYQGVRKSETP